MGRLTTAFVLVALLVVGADSRAQGARAAAAAAAADKTLLKEAIELALEEGKFTPTVQGYKLNRDVMVSAPDGKKLDSIDWQVGTVNGERAFITVTAPSGGEIRGVSNNLKGIKGIKYTVDVMACAGEKECVQTCVSAGIRYCCKYQCNDTTPPGKIVPASPKPQE